MANPEILRAEPSPRWVKAEFNGQVVADSRQTILVWEPRHQLNYFFPKADVQMDLLEQSSDGEILRWNLKVGDREEKAAAWGYADSTLADGALVDHVAFVWRKIDRWLEEDEELVVHPRDPYHRIDAIPSSRHVVVKVNGKKVAESKRPVVLFETGMGPRYYLPEQDVDMAALQATDLKTGCPYKGWANYYSIEASGEKAENVVWQYKDPLREGAPLKNLLAFWNEKVDMEVDGKPA